MGQAAVEKQSDAEVRGPAVAGSAAILTPDAMRFVAVLQREFNPRREQLLAKSIGSRPHLDRAARIFDQLILSDTLADFLTIPAYDELLKLEQA